MERLRFARSGEAKDAQSVTPMFHVKRRRDKLHIVCFPASGKTHSFRCPSSPNQTRFAGSDLVFCLRSRVAMHPAIEFAEGLT